MIDELVMVVPVEKLLQGRAVQGLSYDVDPFLSVVNDPNIVLYMPRTLAEHDVRYKQIIPYVLVRHGARVLSYRRGKLLNESRLRGQYSIGFGGHISGSGPTLWNDSYSKSVERELEEELVIDSPHRDTIVAVVNDDSNEVGRVHFGVVHMWTLEQPVVKAREQSINEVRFLGGNDLSGSASDYENWSQLCIRRLDELLDKADQNQT